MTIWDPVSKQPLFKTAVCRVARIAGGDRPAPAAGGVPDTRGGEATAIEILPGTPVYGNDAALGTDAPAPTRTIAGEA